MITRGVAILVAIMLLAACAQTAPTPTPTTVSKEKPSLPAPAATAKPAAVKEKPAAAPADKPAAKDAGSPKPAQSQALDKLIEDARKEGTVRISISSDIGDKGAKRLIDAFNKKYNLNLKVDYTLAASFRNSMVQVQMETSTGNVPSWDALNLSDSHVGDMIQKNLLEPFDWAGTFPNAPKEAAIFGGRAFVVEGAPHVPVYNTNLVKPADLPKTWDDFLAPKWKGNLVLNSAAGPWTKLAEKWGDEKMTNFLNALAKQEPIYVGSYQVVQRLASGEYPLTPAIMSGVAAAAQAEGAPVRFLEGLSPGGVGALNNFVVSPKAKYPNAARLFMGFQQTPEAQQVWWEETKRASPWGNSPMAEWLKGKDVFFASAEFVATKAPELEDKYRKILGIR